MIVQEVLTNDGELELRHRMPAEVHIQFEVAGTVAGRPLLFAISLSTQRRALSSSKFRGKSNEERKEELLLGSSVSLSGC